MYNVLCTQKNRRRNNSATGFTLIEMIVSLGLFSMVMVLAAGAYLMMINSNRQAQALAFGVNNLSFALDTMARSIRTGTKYRCGSTGVVCSDANGYEEIQFTDIDGNVLDYKKSGSSIQRKINSGTFDDLTDASVVSVTSLKFYVTGTIASDTKQPYVTMVVQASVATAPGKTQTFSVETAAVMRAPDIGT